MPEEGLRVIYADKVAESSGYAGPDENVLALSDTGSLWPGDILFNARTHERVKTTCARDGGMGVWRGVGKAPAQGIVPGDTWLLLTPHERIRMKDGSRHVGDGGGQLLLDIVGPRGSSVDKESEASHA